ncbi:MAG: ATP-binding protein, partial [Elusimicrobiota bacterium]|nr:ATP-binding protein [Endomicrobiia bacterium]MDW8166595.1 ATP-binding protein [Elusimicrobiota bacterium]
IIDKINLSLRGLDRVIKVARTIADLEESEDIKVDHLAEAVSYRGLEDFIS